MYRLLVIIIRFFFYLTNGKPKVTGLEHLDPKEPVIIAGTHRSLLDPFFVAIAVYPHPVAFMAKDSLFKFKPLAWLLKQGYVFPVNRDKPSASTIKHAVSVMNDHQQWLGIFPSGTRHSTEIKSGTAFIQKLSKRDIIPVAIQPPKSTLHFFLRQKAKLAFGTPIAFQVDAKYDKERLAQIDQQLASQFDELDQQLDPNYHYVPKSKKASNEN